MSWMSQLYKTYEENIGKNSIEKIAMAPISHIYKKHKLKLHWMKKVTFLEQKK